MHTIVPTSRPRENAVTSFMALKGINRRDLPQLLSLQYALSIKNYLITKDGRLKKRKGLTKLLEIAGGIPITMIESFTDDISIFGYGTKISAFDTTTGLETVIKTFSSEHSYEGDRSGDYFFITNKTDPIGRISRTLAFDAQTANFTVGKVLTGATSGAKAVILENSDSGAIGTLTLGRITGFSLAFQDNEIITDDNTVPGSATVNGSLTWVYTEISSAPVCNTLKVIGSRLYAGGIKSDRSAIQYCTIDTGINPPFSTWTNSTLSSDGGIVWNRNAGDVQAIAPFINDIIVVFGSKGKWAFKTTTLEVGGSLIKKDESVLSRLDDGGARGAITTPKGLFYINSSGLWQVISFGQDNVPFADQEFVVSQLLGIDYFKDVNIDEVDLGYDGENNTILATVAKDSNINNLVFAYNIDNKSLTDITGWNINRFVTVNGVVYGCSASQTKIYKCFDGSSDDGLDIWTHYRQEIKMGDLYTRQKLKGEYIQGILHVDSEIRVQFDKYNPKGEFQENVLAFLWTASGVQKSNNGWGKVSFGKAGFGGNSNLSGNEVESFDGARGVISNYQRLIIDISAHDKLPHEISWFSLLGYTKAAIRRRTLQKIT